MLRRGLSIVLILGYVASQLAAVPHAHSGDPFHQNHASAPHVHLSWFGDTHHAHRHNRHDHGDHQPAGRSETALPFSSGVVQSAGHDHDADAIYLPTVVAAGKTTDARHSMLVSDEAPVTSDAGSLSASVILHSSFLIRHSRPNHSVWHCALYLQLQTLRI
jgi:hypothetical protein